MREVHKVNNATYGNPVGCAYVDALHSLFPEFKAKPEIIPGEELKSNWYFYSTSCLIYRVYPNWPKDACGCDDDWELESYLVGNYMVVARSYVPLPATGDELIAYESPYPSEKCTVDNRVVVFHYKWNGSSWEGKLQKFNYNTDYSCHYSGRVGELTFEMKRIPRPC